MHERFRQRPRLNVDDAKPLIFVEARFHFMKGRLVVELELLSAKHPVYLKEYETTQVRNDLCSWGVR